MIIHSSYSNLTQSCRSWLFPQVSLRRWFNPSSQDRITPLCSWQRSGSFPVCRNKPAKSARVNIHTLCWKRHKWRHYRNHTLYHFSFKPLAWFWLDPWAFKRNLDRLFSILAHWWWNKLLLQMTYLWTKHSNDTQSMLNPWDLHNISRPHPFVLTRRLQSISSQCR